MNPDSDGYIAAVVILRVINIGMVWLIIAGLFMLGLQG